MPQNIENPIQTQEYELDRKATALKRDGDLDGAIKALYQRKAILGIGYMDTKLAKYLQAAGRFEEAMTEIQWMLNNSHEWALTFFGHHPSSVILEQRTSWRIRIHKDAELICKRAKNQKLQLEHEQQRQVLLPILEKLRAVTKADEFSEMEEFEKVKILKGKQLTQFLHKCQEKTNKNKIRSNAELERLRRSKS